MSCRPVVVLVTIVCCGRPVPLSRIRPQNRVIMSMQPKPWPEVPEETARVAKSAFRKGGSMAIRIRDELGSWYEDADFAAAYPVRGKPGISPAQLAMVTVLQFCENLTSRARTGDFQRRRGRRAVQGTADSAHPDHSSTRQVRTLLCLSCWLRRT